jgi:hypothetical protein
VVSFVAGVVSEQLSSSSWASGRTGVLTIVAAHAGAALVYALTGRVAASMVARVVMTVPFLGL